MKNKVLSHLKWMYPGMNIKRWIILLPVSMIFIIFGVVILIYKRLDEYLGIIARYMMEKFDINIGNNNELIIIAYIAIGIGIVIIYLLLRNLIYSISKSVNPNATGELADFVYKKRFLAGGPRIVVVGGGTGLSTMLRGLKNYSSNITAIVTVSDNGGSSGMLKQQMGIMAPGDIRNCLVALADTESEMEELFQYRFKKEINGLEGHSFGNILIAVLSNITGDFEKAVLKLSDVLAIRGKVYPNSLKSIDLVGEMEDHEEIVGETNIVDSGKKILNMKLSLPNAEAPKDAIEAIENADIIVLGPGSIYTSIIPNLLVKNIKGAINKSKAHKVYICNVMTQPGESDGFTASDHCKTIIKYLGNKSINHVIINNAKPNREVLAKYEESKQFFVEPDVNKIKELGINIVAGNFMSQKNQVRHNPKALAEAIMRLTRY